MVPSRQDGLLQDKVIFLPGKLELRGLQFPLTTNSSPITSSTFPVLWLYSILPAHQFNWTGRAVSCALPFFSEITFIITNDPSAENHFLHFWFLETPTACRSLGNEEETASNCHVWPLSIGGFPLSNDLTHVVSDLHQEERMKPEQIAVLWPVFSPPCQDLAVAIQKM